jgi:UDPglucose 6-dehydrogenase
MDFWKVCIKVKIGVAGIWHLGAMYSIGLAELGHQVIAYDPDTKTIQDFNAGKLQVHEPGLEELLRSNLNRKTIQFTNEESDLSQVDLFVLAYDTPVDELDNPDNEYVFAEFRRIARHLSSNTSVMVTSQLPVGSCMTIREILGESSESPRITVHPENLRLGKALDSFFKPERIIVGSVNGQPNSVIQEAFARISAPIIWMHDKSAEMTKHALNAFLATSVTFMGEIAEICEAEGADAKEVEIGLKSDVRIGEKAYLSPGLGFAGGTLARDVRTLSKLQSKIRTDSTIFNSLIPSNFYNNNWISRTIARLSTSVSTLKICFWGISYTENTTTLRRSEIYREMKFLLASGAKVSFVENFNITEEVDSRIENIKEIEESLVDIDILVVSKKMMKLLGNKNLFCTLRMQTFCILDPSRLLLPEIPELIDSPKYFTVGKGI